MFNKTEARATIQQRATVTIIYKNTKRNKNGNKKIVFIVLDGDGIEITNGEKTIDASRNLDRYVSDLICERNAGVNYQYIDNYVDRVYIQVTS